MSGSGDRPSRAPENVLVTGGGGFLGRAIVTRLRKRGDRVRSLSRRFHPRLAPLGVDQIQGDISDAAIVEQACAGRNLVFHVAAKPPPWGTYKDYYRTNVTGTHNVISACLKQGVKRLVFTSSPSVIFNGTDLEGVNESFPYPPRYNAPYPATKALAEKAVVKAAETALKTIVLRPHEIWGPEDPHFVPRLLARAGHLKQIGSGRNRVDTVYIDNAAEAHVLAADQLIDHARLSGKIYFITQDEPILAWQMINAILQAAGCEPVTQAVPFRIAWSIGALLEFYYRLFSLPGEPKMTRFMAQALATSHWFDIRAARSDLGYAPGITTAEGLKRLEKWLQNKKENGREIDGSVPNRKMGGTGT